MGEISNSKLFDLKKCDIRFYHHIDCNSDFNSFASNNYSRPRNILIKT